MRGIFFRFLTFFFRFRSPGSNLERSNAAEVKMAGARSKKRTHDTEKRKKMKRNVNVVFINGEASGFVGGSLQNDNSSNNNVSKKKSNK